MKIIMALDDVVADTTKSMLRDYNLSQGTRVPITSITSRDYKLGKRSIHDEIWDRMIRDSDWVKRMPIVVGSIPGVMALRNMGYSTEIIVHRPSDEALVDLTHDWILDRFGEYVDGVWWIDECDTIDYDIDISDRIMIHSDIRQAARFNGIENTKLVLLRYPWNYLWGGDVDNVNSKLSNVSIVTNWLGIVGALNNCSGV